MSGPSLQSLYQYAQFGHYKEDGEIYWRRPSPEIDMGEPLRDLIANSFHGPRGPHRIRADYFFLQQLNEEGMLSKYKLGSSVKEQAAGTPVIPQDGR